MCLHYSSWDKSKEWTTDLPKGEEITGLAIGSGWLAAATSVNRLRLFSLGGVQKGLVEVGGQIVATSGNEDLLFVAFHSGFGKVTKLKLYFIATILSKLMLLCVCIIRTARHTMYFLLIIPDPNWCWSVPPDLQ
jgi:hypothetical protein